MIRFLDAEKFEPDNVYIFAYPGIRAGDLERAAREEILPPVDEIGIVIINVGTNDASRGRVDQPVETVVNAILHLFRTLRTIYQNAEFMFSSILPRFDEDDERATQINKFVSVECKEHSVDFMNMSNQFPKSDEFLFRYSETKDVDEISTDVVHLSNQGIAKLQKLLKLYISMKRERTDFSAKPDPMKPAEWKNHCRDHFPRPQGFSRYKITNYEPAMCGKDRHEKAETGNEDFDIPTSPNNEPISSDTGSAYLPVFKKEESKSLTDQSANPYRPTLDEKEKLGFTRLPEKKEAPDKEVFVSHYTPVISAKNTVNVELSVYAPVRNRTEGTDRYKSEPSDTNPYKIVEKGVSHSSAYIPVGNSKNSESKSGFHPYRRSGGRGGKANLQRGYRATH